MFSFWIKEEQTIWLALIISLLIHGFFFAFSGMAFIQHAQYSVQPSDQAVEVSIEEIKDPGDIFQKEDRVIKFSEKIIKAPERIDKAKGSAHSKSGVKLKANPDYYQNPSPEYPELAKQMRQEGLVMLSVDVDRAGEPLNVKIIQSSGYYLLDQAALNAVRRWKFRPGSVGGISVASTVNVPIRFRLEK